MAITNNYRALNTRLHEEAPEWATSGAARVRMVELLAARFRAATILDYGCGKGALSRATALPVTNYDPCVPEFAAPPTPHDLVVCLDVLEHVEPECLHDTLRELAGLADCALYLVIAKGPARHTLPDGRNAHLIQQPSPWWREQIAEAFPAWTVEVIEDSPYWLEVVVHTLLVSPPWPATRKPSAPSHNTLADERHVLRRQHVSAREIRLAPLSLSQAFPSLVRAPLVDGRRAAILCGSHPCLAAEATIVACAGLPVVALNNTPLMLSRCDLNILCDAPEVYRKGIVDSARPKLMRLNYQVDAPGTLYFGEAGRVYDEDDPQYEDWLGMDWLWFKASFPFALQFMYACGIRAIYTAGVRFEATAESTEKQSALYGQQAQWLERQRDYMARKGLKVFSI